MKFSELEVGMKVVDRWFSRWGEGRVTKLLKTRVVISFDDGDTTYDKGHVQFLSRGIYK